MNQKIKKSSPNKDLRSIAHSISEKAKTFLDKLTHKKDESSYQKSFRKLQENTTEITPLKKNKLLFMTRLRERPFMWKESGPTQLHEACAKLFDQLNTGNPQPYPHTDEEVEKLHTAIDSLLKKHNDSLPEDEKQKLKKIFMAGLKGLSETREVLNMHKFFEEALPGETDKIKHALFEIALQMENALDAHRVFDIKNEVDIKIQNIAPNQIDTLRPLFIEKLKELQEILKSTAPPKQ